jgi:hypothetical protein
MTARYWLVFGAVLCGGAFAAQPPPPPASPSAAATPDESQADDEFIEFLGRDDVGDAAWWEFLKKSEPRKDEPPAPPEDPKQ